jgi:hypothetical protein
MQPRYCERSSRIISRVENAIEGTEWSAGGLTIAADKALSPVERFQLEKRLEGFKKSNQPCSEDEAFRLCEIMLACWNSPREGVEAYKIRIGLFIAISMKHPPAALKTVVDLIINGGAGLNPSFAPSIPEFAALLNKISAPMFEAQAKIERVLSAKIVAIDTGYKTRTQEQIDNVNFALEAFKRGLPAKEKFVEKPDSANIAQPEITISENLKNQLAGTK